MTNFPAKQVLRFRSAIVVFQQRDVMPSVRCIANVARGVAFGERGGDGAARHHPALIIQRSCLEFRFEVLAYPCLSVTKPVNKLRPARDAAQKNQ